MADLSDIVGDVAQVLRAGRIVSVDAEGATCTVAIGDPDGDAGDVITTEIPWLALRAGQTIIWSPPSPGEGCLLLCPDGDIAQAVALPGLFCAAFPPPGDPTRQFIQFGDGAELSYDPGAHAMDLDLPGGMLNIVAAGGVTIEGDLHVDGEIHATGDVSAGDISLQSHTHPGVQSGGSSTGEPQ